MASIRDRILDALLLALDAAIAGGMTKPAGLVVHRFRTVPMEEDNLPSIGVYPVGEVKEIEDHNRLGHSLTVLLDHRALVAAGGYPDKAVDPLYVWSVKALKADETFGGLAVMITEGPAEWDNEIQDESHARLTQQWTVLYVTNETDPETN